MGAAVGLRPARTNRVMLLAFAFAVMADPVSSVAYAIEAALRALRGDLQLVLPTMAVVVVGIVLVIVACRHHLSVTPRHEPVAHA